jgi:hypothetical protein
LKKIFSLSLNFTVLTLEHHAFFKKDRAGLAQTKNFGGPFRQIAKDIVVMGFSVNTICEAAGFFPDTFPQPLNK